MKSLHPTVHHLRKASVIRNIDHGQTGILEGLGCATSRKNLAVLFYTRLEFTAATPKLAKHIGSKLSHLNAAILERSSQNQKIGFV